MAIPFAELKYPWQGSHYGMTPSDGDSWSIAFARFSVPAGGEWSYWDGYTFHSSDPLGKIVFKEKSPLLGVDEATGPERALGHKEFEAQVRNISGAASKIDVKIRIAGQERQVQLTLAAAEGQSGKMP